MIHAIAIDDEPLALELIEAFCNDLPDIKLVKTFTKPMEALKYLRQFPVDLLFLDIQMPAITGIDLYQQITQKTMVIFTTAHSEYAIESYNVSAVDYLLKPFEKERFVTAVNKAIAYYQYLHADKEKAEGVVYIRANYSLVKISLNDILYIEGLDDYIKIYLPNQSPVVARMTMKGILAKLPELDFMRIHRSYIVPLNKIESIKGKTVIIEQQTIPVGVNYEQAFDEMVRSRLQ